MAERYEFREDRDRRIDQLERDFRTLLEAVVLLMKVVERRVVPIVASITLTPMP